MNSIETIRDCYGCGVCAVICPRSREHCDPQPVVAIRHDEKGFYRPFVDNKEKCTDCGLCLSVCAFVRGRGARGEGIGNREKGGIVGRIGTPGSKAAGGNRENVKTESLSPLEKPLSPHPVAYAAWSNDEQTRRLCSSGGIGFEIAGQLLEQGYKVCAVRYNVEKHRAEHYIATTVKELSPSIGSKYIQSYTVDALKQINKKDRYVFIGTPCQVDSVRRYARQLKIEDNFIFMDFFCHGVPSMLLWKKYLKEAEKRMGCGSQCSLPGKITSVSWRNKSAGWHDSYVVDVNEESSRFSRGDLFFKFFLSDSCLGEACYRCDYKYDKSAADIRIGDLWGKKYRDNEEGVSALIALTPKGDDVVRNLRDCTLIREPFEIAAEGQMKRSPKRPVYYRLVLRLLRSKLSLKAIYYPVVWVLRAELLRTIVKFLLKKVGK